MKSWMHLAGWVVLCVLVGVTGAVFTRPSIPGWYAELAKPSWTPPDWVFGPVWTTLYILMGVCMWLVWRGAGNRYPREAVTAFLVQLGLNALWSPVFFTWHETGWAFAVILLLVVAIAATIFFFSRYSRAAAIGMAPYLLWVIFASALNFRLWQLNA